MSQSDHPLLPIRNMPTSGTLEIMTRPTSFSPRRRVFQRHLSRLEQRMSDFASDDRRFLRLRLAVFLAGLAAVFLAAQLGGTPAGLITAGLALSSFGVVAFYHRRLDRMRARFSAAYRLAATQIARIERNWEAIPTSAPTAVPPDLAVHPFALDLDLVGDHSLHQLLDTAVSQGGSARLQAWLLQTTPDLPALEARRSLLAELIPRRGFRNHLSLAGVETAADPEQPWQGEKLRAWLDAHAPTESLRRPLLFMTVFALVNVVVFVLGLFNWLPPIWLITVPLYLWGYLRFHRTFRSMFADAYHLGNTLDRFRSVLAFLEMYPYPPGSALAACCTPFTEGSTRPSQHLRAITWVTSAASLQGNPFVWLPLNLAVPWDLFFAHLLNLQKEKLRTLLPRWLDAWYQLEALNSLANFSDLNPVLTFPELHSKQDTAIFQAKNLGHPLLPDDVRVANDLTLDKTGTLLIVTGSNMSGKSTFLRTVGINLVLAYAGGPVQAAWMKTVPLRIFSSIQVSDSLAYGISYFYAEVQRLKKLLDTLETPHSYPLLFLIDEIFRGTNNTERRIGSQSYVEALLDKNGLGLISTHDLELTQMAADYSGVINVHFRESIANNQMAFDYQLYPGPCPTTNALRIMALAGLPVNDPGSTETPAS